MKAFVQERDSRAYLRGFRSALQSCRRCSAFRRFRALRRGTYPTAILTALALYLAPFANKTASAQGSSVPSLAAGRVGSPVSIDGLLDEAAWQEAEAATGFAQFEPNEGGPPSQRTEVRVLYGDASLYIAAVLHDEQPSRIDDALSRRDDINRADWFFVSIDSYFDRRTAYVFGVNAAGVQYDAVKSQGSGGPGPLEADESWDAVWYSSARVTADGWIVEMRIPYSMLRFSDEHVQTWGIHFTRLIPRLSEHVEWPLVPRTDRDNLVARFGLLMGMEGIRPRRNLQIRPYAVSKVERAEDVEAAGTAAHDASADVGGDVKVGLGPNVTLDATINPDFGQVEADPAVLNLSAFETFFDERRPFFVEGTQIFQFSVGPGQLIYTRRIGAESPIIGAAKISGRTARGLSLGLLAASTGSQFEQVRHYGVARMTQQIGGFSSAGGIVTFFNAPDVPGERRSSMVAGADYDLRFRGNRYGVEGFASASHRRSAVPDSDVTGFATKVWLRKRQGDLTGFAGLDIFSDRFLVNDLGQLQENNFVALLSSGEYGINGNRPFGPFQRAGIEYFALQQFSYASGLNLGQSLDLAAVGDLRTFQSVEFALNLEHPFGGYDLYETRGLGPWASPFSVTAAAEVETDSRRNWQASPEVAIGADANGGREFATGISVEWSSGSRLSLLGSLEAAWENGVTAWTSNESFRRMESGWMIGRESGSAPGAGDYVAIENDAGLDGIFSGITPTDQGVYFVPIFGERDTRSLDFTVRGSVTFSTRLSLQLYSQLFLARGRYDHFQILRNRDELSPFEGFPKRDEFAFGNLQSNVVLRWEYRPGSTLYVVWTHGRNAERIQNRLAPWGSSPYDRHLDAQIADVLEVFPHNVFLVKLSYTFLN